MAARNDPSLVDLRDPGMLLALGFGSGLLPKAPGTWGTVVGCLLFAALAPLGVVPTAVATVVAIGVGIPLCGRAAKRLGVHDHSAIVWDEIAGVMLTLLFVPFHWAWLLAGFLLFRFFDVLKPWPISWLDRRVPGGLGIMLDDVLAGAAAGAVLFGAAHLLGG